MSNDNVITDCEKFFLQETVNSNDYKKFLEKTVQKEINLTIQFHKYNKNGEDDYLHFGDFPFKIYGTITLDDDYRFELRYRSDHLSLEIKTIKPGKNIPGTEYHKNWWYYPECIGDVVLVSNISIFFK